MDHSTGSSVNVGASPYSSESNPSNPSSPNMMGMMNESTMSTPSLASSSDTDFGSNGRIPTSPNPEFQIAAYRQETQRHEQIALGIITATIALTALPLLARSAFPIPPPAGYFNRAAVMIGRGWTKKEKAQTWPIDVHQRHRSLASRATERLMAVMQRDREAS